MEDEEFETAADNPLGVQTGSAYSPTQAAEQLARLQEQYTTGQSGLAQARQRAVQSMADRFRRAEESLRAQRFGNPSSSERMFALSQAFLSPQRMPGFHGVLDNIVPVLGQIAGAKRAAGDERAAALAKMQEERAALEEKYAMEGMLSEQKSLLDLMKVYGPLAKQSAQPRPQTTYDPFTRTIVDKTTGTATPVRDVAPPPSQAQLTAGLARLRQYLGSPNATPEGKGQAIMNFAIAANMDPREVQRLLGGN